jgi:hypothetical protein
LDGVVFLQHQLKPLSQFSNILIVTVLWFWHLNFDFDSNLLFFGILLLGTWELEKWQDNTLITYKYLRFIH